MTLPPDLFTGSVSITTSTDGGGNWLSATLSGNSVLVSANPSGLNPGAYSGNVIITGDGNRFIVQVTFSVFGGVILEAGDGARFAVAEGSGAPAPVVLEIGAYCYPAPTPTCPGPIPVTGPLAATAQTRTGGNWLSVVASSSSVSVSANPAGLAAGVYMGFVIVTSPHEATLEIPVALVIQGTALPALVAGPGAIYISGTTIPGVPPDLIPQICITSSDVPISFTTRVTTSDGGNWLSSYFEGSTTPTPACLRPTVDEHLPPGTYTGQFVFSAGGQSVTVPVTYEAPGPAARPLLASITDAASGLQGAIAPGEMVAIHGIALGPASALGASVGQAGALPTTLGGTRVLLGNIAAPLLYASATQVNAIIPYEIEGRSDVPVQVQVNGVPLDPWTVPVVVAAPGVFTSDSSGTGAAAVLNQDNSVNSPSKPTTRGSTIQIFLTGVGQTSPPSRAGAIASSQDRTLSPVSVTIGGAAALVVYAGSVPKSAFGLAQVNAVVPPGIAAGSTVPVLVTAGQEQSQAGVTIAVQ